MPDEVVDALVLSTRFDDAELGHSSGAPADDLAHPEDGPGRPYVGPPSPQRWSFAKTQSYDSIL
jgi:hypothetical protein